MQDARFITVLGSFVADLAFRTPKLPSWGETVMGQSFAISPGGKGSNQAVAAARARRSEGARISFASMLGRDTFGDMARELYSRESIDTRHLLETDEPTGAAAILVDAQTGGNGIVVVPGACFGMRPEHVDAMQDRIASSCILLMQLELPVSTVAHALRLARELRVPTILNPAPACVLPPEMLANCDYLTPNESEAEALTGIPVRGLDGAEQAARSLRARGVCNVVITLGAEGCFVSCAEHTQHVPSFFAGPAIDTTGAGDAFNGAFAVALSEGASMVEAARFGCAAGALSTTRPGTANSMPARSEIDRLLNQP